jgi:outer membrane protein TolC
MGVTPRVEHHSREPDDASSPWSLGFEIEIPLGEGTRREAIKERVEYLADAADLKVGSAAWAVRSEVRARLLDYYSAGQDAGLLDRQRQQLRALVTLLERRLEAGAAARGEVTNARLRQSEIEGLAQTAALARERSLAGLSRALGVSLAVVKSLSFDFGALEQTPASPGDAALQRTALQNRLDVRAKLLEYSAADAAVKLEVVRQYPSFSISPGYLWDQGDNVWSLAATLLLPAGGHKPAILAAEARREVAAQEFLALQGRVISEADGAQARYRSAVEGAGSVSRAAQLLATRTQEAKKQFDAGQIDRLELTLAQIEALSVQRNTLTIHTEAQRALSALEDALQTPLTGGPLPAWAHNPPSSPDLAQR